MTHIPDNMMHRYIDGELERESRRTVDVHLASCLACKKTYESYVRLRSLIEITELRVPSENFTEKVMGNLHSIPSSVAIKSESGLLSKMPYMFAAGLTAIVVIYSLFLGSEDKNAFQASGGNSSLIGKINIPAEYTSQISDFGDKLIGILSLENFSEYMNSPAMTMLLFFVGSILIYQIFDLMQDKFRHRKTTLNLFV